MVKMGIAEARSQFAHVIGRTQHEPVALARHGRTRAILVSADEYERLLAAREELEYIAACENWASDEVTTFSWQQVMRDYGWK